MFTIDEMPVCASSVDHHIKAVQKFANGEAETLPKMTDSDLIDFCECVDLLKTGYANASKNQ